MLYTKGANKLYIRIPGGEIQFGYKSKRLVVWFRGNLYRVYKGKFSHKI